MSVLVGRIGLVVKGAWDSSVAYATMDIVTYNNSTYIAKQAVPAGTLPTNTTYWELSLDASLLQTKTLSSPVTIGGESKTTVEAAVGALEDVKADKTAISSVETTNTAVSAHAVGSYFINASGQFVKTTSAIAIGDTIIVKPTVGYNCEVTTLSNEIDVYEDISSKFVADSTNVSTSYLKAYKRGKFIDLDIDFTPTAIPDILSQTFYTITDSSILPISDLNICGIYIPVIASASPSIAVPFYMNLSVSRSTIRTTHSGAYGGITEISTASEIIAHISYMIP